MCSEFVALAFSGGAMPAAIVCGRLGKNEKALKMNRGKKKKQGENLG